MVVRGCKNGPYDGTGNGCCCFSCVLHDMCPPVMFCAFYVLQFICRHSMCCVGNLRGSYVLRMSLFLWKFAFSIILSMCHSPFCAWSVCHVFIKGQGGTLLPPACLFREYDSSSDELPDVFQQPFGVGFRIGAEALFVHDDVGYHHVAVYADSCYSKYGQTSTLRLERFHNTFLLVHRVCVHLMICTMTTCRSSTLRSR